MGGERRESEPSVVSNFINAAAPDDDLSSPAPAPLFKSWGSWRRELVSLRFGRLTKLLRPLGCNSVFDASVPES